jgi:hypothetical protein
MEGSERFVALVGGRLSAFPVAAGGHTPSRQDYQKVGVTRYKIKQLGAIGATTPKCPD